MQIHNFELGPIGVNCFLIVPEAGGAVVVDAPEGAFEAVSNILSPKGIGVGAVLLTHGHWDHIWDAKKFRDAGARIFAHPDGSSLIEKPGFQAPFMFFGGELEPAKIDVKLYDGQTLEFGGCKFEVRSAPGHCPGSVVYVLEGADTAFVGDVIFSGSIGRTDLPGGSFAELEKSIRRKVYTLPETTRLLPGHGPFTTVSEEKSSNPFVRS